MSSSKLIRWGGLLILVASALMALGFIFHPPMDAEHMAGTAWVVDHVVIIASLVLIIPGLFALYARQLKETGGLGLIGFILLFISHASFLGVVHFELFVIPTLAVKTPEILKDGLIGVGALGVALPVTGVLLVLGYLVFGIAMIRARILPRWACVLLMVGAFPVAFKPALAKLGLTLVASVGAVIFGLGAGWLGYSLWAEKRTVAA